MTAPSASGCDTRRAPLRLRDAGANRGRLNAMTRAMWRELRAVFERQLRARRAAALRDRARARAAPSAPGGDISEYPSFRFDEAEPARIPRERGRGPRWPRCSPATCRWSRRSRARAWAPAWRSPAAATSAWPAQSSKFGAPIAKLGFPMAPREAALVHGAIGDALRATCCWPRRARRARLYDAGFLLHVVPDARSPRGAGTRPAHRRAGAEAARSTSAPAPRRPVAHRLLATRLRLRRFAEHREGIAAFLAKRTPVF